MMTDEPQPTVREHSDEWCLAIERERLAQIAELETETVPKLEGRIDALDAHLELKDARLAERDAEITRLRAVIAQLREDWRPKAQQEIAAMTAAREVARWWIQSGRHGWDRDVYLSQRLDRLAEAIDNG